MRTTEFKALEEVWAWKESAYEEHKHLTLRERMRAVRKKMKPVADQIRKEQKENLESRKK